MNKKKEYENIAADLYQTMAYIVFSILDKEFDKLEKIPEAELIKLLDNVSYIANEGNGQKHDLLPFPKLDKKEPWW